MYLYFLNAFSLIFYLFLCEIKCEMNEELSEDYLYDTNIESSVLLSLEGKCEIELIFSEEYKFCKLQSLYQMNRTYEEFTKNSGNSSQTLRLHYDCCLNWKLLDCLEDSIKSLCPETNFNVSRQEWLDLVRKRYNCSLIRTEYENRIEKCFDYYSDEFKSQKHLITNDWRVFSIAVFITFAVFVAILVRKVVSRYQKKRYSQSLPVRMDSLEDLFDD